MAYDLAERNGILHNFNNQSRKSGWSWYKGFLRRHPRLSVRTPENTSLSRARGFNEQSVKSFYNIFKELKTKYGFSGDRIFNVVEKGVSTVPHNPPKNYCYERQKKMGVLLLEIKEQRLRLFYCKSATGFYVPPLFIFPRVKNYAEHMIGTPPGST